MTRRDITIGVLALLAVAACTHRVTQSTDPQRTARLVAAWPDSIEGVLLRDGSIIELPSQSNARLEDDTLIVRTVPVGSTVQLDTIPVRDVSHVIVRRLHKGRTIAAAIIIPVAIIGTIALIAESTEDEPDPPPQTSCPFIYAFDGSRFVPVAEPLGGAVSRGMQRTDLSRLEGLTPVGGEYQLVIANEMREVQYLDAFDLIAADHPLGTTVIADRSGRLHVTGSTIAPSHASVEDRDIRGEVSSVDDRWWSPSTAMATFDDGNARDTVTFTFARPAVDDARLVLHTRTSRLAAHSLKAMLELWGSEVDHWYGLLDGSPAARSAHEQWIQREELFVMRVWVRETSGWVAQDAAVGGGPYISELQAVTLDLSRVSGDVLEVRLHPPTGFWDIDFVALDTTRSAPPVQTTLRIVGTDPIGDQDARALLQDEDGAHLVMAETGQRFGVVFAAPPLAAGMTRTLFSRSTGYYRIETDRTGARQTAQLDSLWLEPGYGVKLAQRLQAARSQRAAAMERQGGQRVH